MTLSLARLSGFSLFLIVLAVASAGAGGYFFFHTLTGEYQARGNQLAVRDAQARVETTLRQYQQTLAQIADQEEIISLMGTDKTNERNAKAAQLAGYIPFAMKVRLFVRGEARLDTTSLPHFGYACVELLQRAERGAAIPHAEFHLSDTQSAHIDILQAIRASGNDVALGYIVASIDPAVFRNSIKQDTTLTDYVELRQYLAPKEFVVLGKTGTALAGGGAADLLQPIAHTDWKIALWPVATYWQPSTTDAVYTGAALLLALLLLILVPLVMHVIMTRSLRQDTEAMVGLVRDIRLGTLKNDYTVRLRDFKPLIDALRHSGSALIADHTTLMEMAQVDTLTGLATRGAFDLRLNQLFDQNRMGFPSALMLIDIDHVRDLNDKFGHEATDKRIQSFAAALKVVLRKSDFVARTGGDKFGVIFPFTDLVTAINMSKHLRAKLTAELEKSAAHESFVTWSGGLAAMQAGDTAALAALSRAEQALQHAKTGGGNQTFPGTSAQDTP